MGVLLAGGLTGLLNQSSAQMVDGSLKFDSSQETQLSRTPSSAGNRRTWTWSGWVKKQSTSETNPKPLFTTNGGSNSTSFTFRFDNSTDDVLRVENDFAVGAPGGRTSAKFRDYSGWLHVVLSMDTTQASISDGMKIYVNGTQHSLTNTVWTQNIETNVNSTVAHFIGGQNQSNRYLDGMMSQVYFIDGQALGPESFGFTDGLTNTWRPKKYTGSVNAPVSFSILAPILNTNSDGSAVTSGTRTDSNNSNWILGLAMNTSANIYTDLSPSDGDATDYSNVTASTTQSKYYGTSAYFNGSNAKLIVNDSRFNFSATNFTMETWIYVPTTPTVSEVIFCSSNPDLIGSSSTAGVLVGWNSSNQLFVYVGSDSTPSITNSAATAVSTGKWHHIAIAKSGSTITLYIDGSASGTTSSSVGNSTSGLYVAYQPTNNRWFEAYYQDLRVYTTAKYTSNFSLPIAGVNGFYLPFDGNSPIGEDKSGNGNNWTPVNFGGSVALDNPIVSGALPILNTDGGGNVARVGVRTDAYHANLFLALPLVGNDDDVSNQINSGSTTKVATNSSVAASSAQSNFYGGSHYWSANSDSLTYAEQGSELVFGTGDYTIECWLYDDNGHNGTSNRCYIFDNRIGGSVVGDPPTMVGHIDSHNEFNFYDGTNTITHTVSSTVGKWWHYAVTREGTTTRMFIDGVLRGSNTSSTNFTNNGIGVGRATDANYGMAGYIQDFRIYKGVAKYTSNFVVPATSPDILPDTPSGVSGGSKLAKVTDGAVGFDGSGDYLTGPSTDTFVSDAQYTIDGFIYLNSAPGNNAGEVIFDTGSGGSDPELNVFNNSGNIQLYDSLSNNTNWNGGASYMGVKKWHYFKQTVNGSSATDASATHKLYIDGKLGVSNTINLSSRSASSVFAIGARTNGSVEINAFISNFRYRSVLDDSLTVPTSPLTDVTNTKLLCCQSNTLAGAAAVTPVTGNTGYTGTSQSITLNQANLNAGTVANVVDGSTSTSADIRDAGSFVELIFPQQQNGELQVNVSNGNDVGDDNIRVFIDGVEGPAFDVSSQSWHTIHTGNFTTVKLEQQGSTTGNIFGFRIGTGGDTIISKSVAPVGNAAATNFNPFNTDINTVRGQETGYCTFNVLRERSGGYNPTFKDGNLFMDGRGDGTGTLSASSGKFYFEVLIDTVTTSGQIYLGVQDAAYGGAERGWSTAQIAAMRDTNTLYGNGATGSGVTYGVGDLMSFAFDADNNKLYIAKNGIYLNGGVPSQGTGFTHSGISFAGGYTPIVSDGQTGQKYRLNCGQKPFKYAPPDGFQPLNAANVKPVKVFARPDQYVGATLWTGNGGAQTVSGLNHTPDLIWHKIRTITGGHQLYDSVRGVTKRLRSDTNDAESTLNGVTAFNFDGWSMSAGNNSGENYVSWTWKAGGNKNTFNVDDVGYASASDVNMSVGALNSSAYNQTQTWSNALASSTGFRGSEPATNAFDGDTSSICSAVGSGTITFTSPVTFSSDSTIRVIVHGGDTTVSVNGGADQTISAGSLQTVTYSNSGNATFIMTFVRGGGADTGVRAVEIGGKLLVDNGVTPPNVPSIAPTGASVGTKQGFSIIKYTGPNDTNNHEVPHGLSQAPDFIITKNLDTTFNWDIYHSSLADDAYLIFTTAATRAQGFSGRPTSTVFKTEHNYSTNENQEYIAYLWHDVRGLQKFGNYTGNGNADGPFIELGFRPAVVLRKCSSTGGSGYDWVIIDTERNSHNISNNKLYPQYSGAENVNSDNSDSGDNSSIDILSNGFKVRASNGRMNQSGQTFIYAAWAEAPTFNLFGAQSNAR